MTAALRIGLAILAVAAWGVGVWNLVWPESFYTDFPGPALTPPFSEHYARDYGGTTVGTAIVLTAATLFPRSVLVIPALLAVLAFAAPHAWFHLHHVGEATPDVAAFVLILTIGQPVVSFVLLVLALVRWRSERGTGSSPVVPMEA
jgi:hypothetical protein